MFDPAWRSRRSRSTATEPPQRRGLRAHLRRVPARPLWAAVVAVVVGDLVSTMYGLGIGLTERNPVVAAVLADYGFAGLVALKGVTLASVGTAWLLLERHYGVAVLVGVALPQTVAVVVNAVTIATVVT